MQYAPTCDAAITMRGCPSGAASFACMWVGFKVGIYVRLEPIELFIDR
jgi:hypothetical protein